MKTIAILSRKGGTGKTTLAINLGVAAEKSLGGGVALIDLDPQASAVYWSSSRSESTPRVQSAQDASLPKSLEDVRQAGIRLVLIDTAPHSESAALVAACAADLVLIPCRPAILDLRAIGSTLDLIRQAGTPCAVVLNAILPRGSLADEAAEAVLGYGVALAPIRLTQRSAFIHSLTLGKAIQEYEPRGKGADEIRRLWDWVESAVGF